MGIRITKEGISKMRRPEAGWHKFKITKAIEKPAKKDKRSNNIVCTMEVIESADGNTNNIGRSLDRYFNDSENAIGFLANFLSAVWNTKDKETEAKLLEMAENEEEFSASDFEGLEVWNEVEEGVYNNKPTVNISDNWAHADSKPPF